MALRNEGHSFRVSGEVWPKPLLTLLYNSYKDDEHPCGGLHIAHFAPRRLYSSQPAEVRPKYVTLHKQQRSGSSP